MRNEEKLRRMLRRAADKHAKAVKQLKKLKSQKQNKLS